MGCMYNHPSLGYSCIISETRKHRPNISEDAQKACPFCKGNEHLIEKVYIEKALDDGDCIKIINNKYPVCIEGVDGIHDVIVDTNSHDKSPLAFTHQHWVALFESIKERIEQIKCHVDISFIQVFKNYGKHAGASIAHSHWQIIALNQTPLTMVNEYKQTAQYVQEKGCLFCKEAEEKSEQTYIYDTAGWLAYAPTCTSIPHETWIIPKLHKSHFEDLSKADFEQLATLMMQLLQAYEVILPNGHYNICMMAGRPGKDKDYHLFFKILPRTGNFAGFELATGCFISVVGAERHAQDMRDALNKIGGESK